MAYQTIFKRYEMKYLITREQLEKLLKVMDAHMKLDEYGHSTIRNIYFDTDNYRMIRRSLEKPTYKEKLRIRSYSQTNADSPVFVELKKKMNSLVYKRRVVMPELEAKSWLSGASDRPNNSQIANEIDYVLNYYQNLQPSVFLSYERDAYRSINGDPFRVTFDDHILSREADLTLGSEVWGQPLLDDDYVMMELKTSAAIPLWMTRFLSEEKIYKTSFSKYGTAYNSMILERAFGTTSFAQYEMAYQNNATTRERGRFIYD